MASPAPGPASAPSQPEAATDPGPTPLSTAPVVAFELVPNEEGDMQSSDLPETASAPAAPLVEINIEDGELEPDVDRIYPEDGQVRVRIGSDELVIVEVEDQDLSWAVPAGAEALIEFETRSTKRLKLKLHRHKGVLVLHLRD